MKRPFDRFSASFGCHQKKTILMASMDTAKAILGNDPILCSRLKFYCHSGQSEFKALRKMKIVYLHPCLPWIVALRAPDILAVWNFEAKSLLFECRFDYCATVRTIYQIIVFDMVGGCVSHIIIV